MNAIITVNDRAKLRVYKREPTTFIPSIEAGQWQRWLTPEQIAPPEYGGVHLIGTELGGQVKLLGYDIDTTKAQAGGTLEVTLYWQALKAFDENFQTFIHVLDGDELVAQHDGAPECGVNPTTRWEEGQIVPDTHVVQIGPQAATGTTLNINAGMYSLIGQVPFENPSTGTKYVPLTELTIQP